MGITTKQATTAAKPLTAVQRDRKIAQALTAAQKALTLLDEVCDDYKSRSFMLTTDEWEAWRNAAAAAGGAASLVDRLTPDA